MRISPSTGRRETGDPNKPLCVTWILSFFYVLLSITCRFLFISSDEVKEGFLYLMVGVVQDCCLLRLIFGLAKISQIDECYGISLYPGSFFRDSKGCYPYNTEERCGNFLIITFLAILVTYMVAEVGYSTHQNARMPSVYMLDVINPYSSLHDLVYEIKGWKFYAGLVLGYVTFWILLSLLLVKTGWILELQGLRLRSFFIALGTLWLSIHYLDVWYSNAILWFTYDLNLRWRQQPPPEIDAETDLSWDGPTWFDVKTNSISIVNLLLEGIPNEWLDYTHKGVMTNLANIRNSTSAITWNNVYSYNKVTRSGYAEIYTGCFYDRDGPLATFKQKFDISRYKPGNIRRRPNFIDGLKKLNYSTKAFIGGSGCGNHMDLLIWKTCIGFDSASNVPSTATGSGGGFCSGRDLDLVQPVIDAAEGMEIAQERFYIEVRSQGTHTPYELFAEDDNNLPENDWNSQTKAMYYADQYIGRVVEAIRKSSRLSNLPLLIIISSDHGMNVPKTDISNYHIPFTILDVNNRVFKDGYPTQIDQIGANYDFPATVHDLVGLPPIPGSIGKSLRRRSNEANRFVYSIDGDKVMMQNSTHFITVRLNRNLRAKIELKSTLRSQWKPRRLLSVVYTYKAIPDDIRDAYWNWESYERYCKSSINV